MKSKVRHSLCPLSIIAALKSYNADTKTFRIDADNDDQINFIDLVNSYIDHPLLDSEDVKAICSNDKKVLKQFIKDNNIEISVPMPGPAEIVMIGLYHFISEWLFKGQKQEYTVDGTKYKYAKMEEDGIIQYKMKNFSDIFEIKTKNKRVSVFLTQDISLEEITIDTLKNISHLDFASSTRDYQELAFPMVDFKEEFDLNEMLDLDIGGYKINEAKQLNKLKMNHERVEVRSETMLKAKRAAVRKPPQPYIINRPFLLWVKHSGSNLPVAAFYLDKKYWKAN